MIEFNSERPSYSGPAILVVDTHLTPIRENEVRTERLGHVGMVSDSHAHPREAGAEGQLVRRSLTTGKCAEGAVCDARVLRQGYTRTANGCTVAGLGCGGFASRQRGDHDVCTCHSISGSA